MEGVDVGPNCEGYYDAGYSAHEYAFDAAMDYNTMLWSMRHATLNLFSAALYHLYEQSMIDLPLAFSNRPHERTQFGIQQVIDWLREQLGVDVKTLSSWPMISELRLVANTVKHGEGRSAENLRKLRPDLFVLPFAREAGTHTGPTRVRKPLFGDGLWVNRDDFTSYHAASVAFWTELAARLGRIQ